MEKNTGLIWVVSFGAIVAFHFVVYMGWLQCVCVCVYRCGCGVCSSGTCIWVGCSMYVQCRD